MMKNSHIEKISAKDALVGMYVCQLDCPWQQTPFAVRGFYTRDLGEIKQLNIHCDYIFIDTQKGISAYPKAAEITIDPYEQTYKGKLAPLTLTTSSYPNHSLHDVMEVVEQSYNDVLHEVSEVITLAKKNNLKNIQHLSELTITLVRHTIKNPDALVWLVRVRKNDDRSYNYLLRTLAWGLLLGRHLGLAKSDLYVISLSLMLKDIGVYQLPRDKIQQYRQRLPGKVLDQELGKALLLSTFSLLKDVDGVHPKVIKTLKMQGERLNGSGYPHHLKGDEIFILSKIVAIASVFDDLSYLAGAKCATPTVQVVGLLYKTRGIQFQDELMVEFIKAIGLYPTGTLVKLTNDEIAIVVEQSEERHLKPTVLVVLDDQEQPLAKYKMIDLLKDQQKKQALMDSGKKNAQKISVVDIVEEVIPYKYPINVTKIRKTHIERHIKKPFFSFLTFS